VERALPESGGQGSRKSRARSRCRVRAIGRGPRAQPSTSTVANDDTRGALAIVPRIAPRQSLALRVARPGGARDGKRQILDLERLGQVGAGADPNAFEAILAESRAVKKRMGSSRGIGSALAASANSKPLRCAS